MNSTDELLAIQTRFDKQMVQKIESWRRRQIVIPPLATTIRILVAQGLKASETEK